MDADDVSAILRKLQSLGFCADLKIPCASASTPSEVFDVVLAAFLREAYPGGREARPLPAALADGRLVDLLRLFAAVRRAGGYAAASSSPGAWAAAAESTGLDAGLAAPVKLLYAKYLGALERWLQRVGDVQEPFLDNNGRKQQHVVLKRKWEDMVAMLDWVRELAKNSRYGGTAAARLEDGYFSMALTVREALVGKRARRGSLTNGALSQDVFPMICNCWMCSTTSRIDVQANCSQRLKPVVQHPNLDINLGSSTTVENVNGSLMATGQENNLNGQGKHEARKQLNSFDGWLFTNLQWNEVPVGSNHQAQVPQWTGKPPVDYNDPDTLKWLGTKVWPPENENKKMPFRGDPIGKGRDDICECNLPGSVECVRFHVAERRLQLKRELSPTFYLWGFDRMGEEIALAWTDEEEANFKAVVRLNAPSSGRNFWDHLHVLFRSKGRKELVSYYFNVFLLRRRCYQNRLTPNMIDSDDEEETEFRFLGNRLGHGATKYHNAKHTLCIQNTHCMDLDE